MPDRTFSYTEERILDAKDKFDVWMLAQPPMSREELLTQWRGFLARWHSDLKALSWLTFKQVDKR